VARRGRLALPALALGLATGCAETAGSYGIQRDARNQIWLSEASQVKVRAAQSRFYDTHDTRRMLEAVVAAFQDAGFQVEVLDPVLGIVSGKKFLAGDRSHSGFDAGYTLYDEESLVAFTRAYRGWGPFWHRSDLVRLTVTVRERNEKQLVVRAAAQTSLRPIEEPEPYREFFRTLEAALFLERQAAP
jgi:hypothetical protein